MTGALPLLFLAAHAAHAAHSGTVHQSAIPQNIQRTILALYDGISQKDVRDTRVHRLLEMPLNHLGLIVRYRDFNRGLPSLQEMHDVRGILIWLQVDSAQRYRGLLPWAEVAIDAGKRFVVFGDLSALEDARSRGTAPSAVNHFLAKLGMTTENWTSTTYNVKVVFKDPAVMDFERPLPLTLPPFERFTPIDPRVQSHLIVRQSNDARTDSHLVVTGPHGGLIANGYTHFASYRQDQLQWYINPFEFLRLALATDDLPKLDTTTVSGRRIYYSHIDGDGWRNLTEVPEYRAKQLSSAAVILRTTIEPFPDLPVTVGPIAADLDPDWFGDKESIEDASRIFAVPWVQAGSHTYSHPLDWETLTQTPLPPDRLQGLPFLERIAEWFDPRNWTALERARERWSGTEAEEGKPSLRRGHTKLRSYELYPFDLNQEIGGSVAFLNRLLPPGKHVELIQWPGTTLEPEAALRATRAAGVRNINGGDTRFDSEFASYAWVAPLGRQAGGLRQVYSSNSNENTYTNLWNERFFGFRYLAETVRNTESPIRVKPFNLYYHMYSGEKAASLKALLENLTLARSLELAPITASQYAAVVDGFFSAKIIQLASRRWRIEDRDGLNTVRFDHATTEQVDFAASAGVVGERHFQGSLYVALDAAEPAPVVSLSESRNRDSAERPYLIQSRWQIFQLRVSGGTAMFEARGFGPGEMEWQEMPGRRYAIRVSDKKGRRQQLEALSDAEGHLRFTLVPPALEAVSVEIAAVAGSR